jgi:hypothetical protein
MRLVAASSTPIAEEEGRSSKAKCTHQDSGTGLHCDRHNRITESAFTRVAVVATSGTQTVLNSEVTSPATRMARVVSGLEASNRQGDWYCLKDSCHHRPESFFIAATV